MMSQNIASTSSECWATEKAWSPLVWPFQRATRARPWAMSEISMSSGEGSSRSSRRPDSMRCQARGGAPARSGHQASSAPAASCGKGEFAQAGWQASPARRRPVIGSPASIAVLDPVDADDGKAPSSGRRAERADRPPVDGDLRARRGQGAVGAGRSARAAARCRDAACATRLPGRHSSPSGSRRRRSRRAARHAGRHRPAHSRRRFRQCRWRCGRRAMRRGRRRPRTLAIVARDRASVAKRVSAEPRLNQFAEAG